VDINLLEMRVARLQNCHVGKTDWPFILQCHPQMAEVLRALQFLETRCFSQHRSRCMTGQQSRGGDFDRRQF
jgi:hypothetical protein